MVPLWGSPWTKFRMVAGMAVEVGQRISDYEILDLLGSGGMGRVFRVRNVISDRIDAMKVLLPDLTLEPDLAARFTAEIRTLAGFDHPNIAQLRTAFTYDNQLVMIMEYIEGVTLEQRARRSALSIAEVLDYASQALSALSYAHGRGVVHRDIKPANMMVTTHGILKLMDFGIAKSATEMQLTRTGTTIGSLYYMSPEQVKGITVDARSDIYSVGITWYELLTGRRPFQADTTYTVLDQQLNSPPQPPIELNPNLPKGLNDIILMALAKDPEQRFQTAEAFRNALKHAVAVQDEVPQVVAATASTSVPPSPVQEPAWQPIAAPVTPVPTPPPVMPNAFNAAPAPPVAPVVQKSRRGLWMGLGAVAALIALIAAATVVPSLLRTHASPEPAAVATMRTDTPEVPSAKPSPPPATPALTTVDGSTTPTVGPNPAEPTPPATPSKSAPGNSHASAKPDRSSSVSADAVSAAAMPAPPGPSAQELTEADEQLMQLSARANAVKAAVGQIERQQEASGLGMRSDMVAAQSRMNAYMESAQRAMRARDLSSAKAAMDKAEKEINTLETFTGKS